MNFIIIMIKDEQVAKNQRAREENWTRQSFVNLLINKLVIYIASIHK